MIGWEGNRASAAPPESPVSFSRDVAPVLVERCQGCHGPEKARGKYRLDTFDRLRKPGSSDEPALSPGKPDASTLYTLLVTADAEDRMPKKADPLPAGQVALVRRWIEQGAAFDGPDPAAALTAYAKTSRHPDPPAVYRHPVAVTALAFGPDGKTLAASGYHEVTLWDAETGAAKGRVKDLPQRVMAVAWSPDGARLAVAGGTPGTSGEVRLIDPAGASPPKVLDRIGDLMLAVRFSPDGKLVAAGGADNAVRVYDATTGERRLLVEQHADWVTDVAFSPDGSRLASASRDKTCRVFDAKTGAMESAYVEQHAEPVYAVTWSRDGRRVASGGRDRKLHYWDAADGKTAFDEKKGPKRPGLGADVSRLVTAGDDILAACSDGTIRSFRQGPREMGREIGKLDAWAYAVTFDEKSGRAAAGGEGGAVRVWDVKDGRQVAAFVAAPK